MLSGHQSSDEDARGCEEPGSPGHHAGLHPPPIDRHRAGRSALRAVSCDALRGELVDTGGPAVLDQRAEQAVAGRRRVRRVHGGGGEQQREVERRGRTRTARPAGWRRPRCSAARASVARSSRAALEAAPRSPSATSASDQRGGEHVGETTGTAPAGRLGCGAVPGRGELGVGLRPGRPRRTPARAPWGPRPGWPTHCGGGLEPGAAVELVGRPSVRLPLERGGARWRRTARPTASSCQPRREPGPGRQQGLVGHLEVLAVASQQPAADQGLDDPVVSAGSAPTARQLGDRQPAGPQRPVLVLLRQPDEDPPGPLLLLVGQRGVDLLGGAADRAGDAAGREVARQGQRRRPAAVPRSARAPSRAAAAPPTGPGRPVPRRRSVRAPPLGPLPRRGLLAPPDAARPRSSAAPSPGRPSIRCARSACSASRPRWSPRTTSTHRATTSSSSSPSDGVEERRSVRRVGLGRPELFQLVAHQDHRASVASSPVSGARASTARDPGTTTSGLPRLAPGKRPRAERRQQPGPHHRGLPGAAGARRPRCIRWSTRAVTSVLTSRSRPRNAVGVLHLVAGEPLVRAALTAAPAAGLGVCGTGAARGRGRGPAPGPPARARAGEARDRRRAPRPAPPGRGAAHPAPHPAVRSDTGPARACAHRFSCSGCSATRRSSSGTASGCRPSASSASQYASVAWSWMPSEPSPFGSSSGVSGHSGNGRPPPERQRLVAGGRRASSGSPAASSARPLATRSAKRVASSWSRSSASA